MDPQSILEQNLVERYVTGRLSAEETARFEEYFLEHPTCAAEVQAAQRLKRGLEAVAAREVVHTSLVVDLWRRFRRRRAAFVAPLLLMALALLPLSLLRRIDQLEANLEAARQPQVNTPIFELSSFRGSDFGTAPPHLLTLSPDPEWIVLTLALQEPEQPLYRAELRDAEKQLVWEATDLRPDGLGRLVMTLPSTLLPGGDYEIRVEGATGGTDPVAVGRFALRVTFGV